jgi:hypothetical protein
MEDFRVYLEILIEDASGGILINHIMSKYKEVHPNMEFRIHSFKGIGYPKKTKSTDDLKTKKLLTDLPIYLRGISKQLEPLGVNAAIIVILDNDRRNCAELKQLLLDIAQKNNAKENTAFCIAIEEMEAWLLGDINAINISYPSIRMSNLTGYTQDSIVGTWETLANAIYPGGLLNMKKDCTTYREIGSVKCEWSDKIGKVMELSRNSSPSFQYLIRKLDNLVKESEDRE